MNLHLVRRWLRPWLAWTHARRLSTIPAYAKAVASERDALRRGCTRAVGKAREAKSEALHASLRASTGRA